MARHACEHYQKVHSLTAVCSPSHFCKGPLFASVLVLLNQKELFLTNLCLEFRGT